MSLANVIFRVLFFTALCFMALAEVHRRVVQHKVVPVQKPRTIFDAAGDIVTGILG